MRLIIAGSRDIWPSVEFIDDMVKSLFPSFLADGDSVLLNGGAQGVDAQALKWSMSTLWEDRPDYEFQVEHYPADWDTFGKEAGPRRNRKMAENADALLLLWDGETTGSKSMLVCGKVAGLKIVSVESLSKKRFPQPFIPGQRYQVNFSAYEAPGIAVGNTKAISKLQLGNFAKDLADDMDAQILKELQELNK
jgi:hypothetical protein